MTTTVPLIYAFPYENSEVKLYKNDGNFNFTDVSISIGIYPYSRQLPTDLALRIRTKTLIWTCIYVATILINSQNKYFENQGDGTFIDKTVYFNLGNGTQSSFMGVWFDYNNDRRN